MNIIELRSWADRCEAEGRTAQAVFVRNIAWEIEHGATWLEVMSPINIPLDGKEPN